MKILVKYCDSKPISVLAEEHVGYDDHGMDIVCAAVSALTQTLIEAIAEVGQTTDFKYEIKEAYLYVERPFNCDDKTANTVDIVFKTILTGLKVIKDMYPNFIEFQEEEVQCHVNEL